MDQNCLCAIGDPNHCSSCDELQDEFNTYCFEMHEAYLHNEEEQLELWIDRQGADQ